MAFKDSTSSFVMMDLALIDADPGHVRQSVSEEGLSGLSGSIRKLGIIQPLLVRATGNGRYTVVVGERRRQAALLAGETTVPVLVCAASDEEALDIRVFDNIGLGIRAPLEPREMANAIQAIAARFASPEEAAEYFGRTPTWLAQATAAANLSEKVTALLDAGKIGSTSAAVQLEKIARKDEAKAVAIIDQIAQLPEGEKVSKKEVDKAVSADDGQLRRKTAEPLANVEAAAAEAATRPVAAPASTETPAVVTRPAEPEPAQPLAASRINPGKVKLVADLLGLSEDDEEALLAKLIDEFLVLKGQPQDSPPF